MMQCLGVAHSRNRPAVSNDYPYSESLFKTLKYRPQLPLKRFECLLTARRWGTELVHWYNGSHRHSSIGFVTPDQRHVSLGQALLRVRPQVNKKEKEGPSGKPATLVRAGSRLVLRPHGPP